MVKKMIVLFVVSMVLSSCGSRMDEHGVSKYSNQLVKPEFKVSSKTEFFILDINKILEKKKTTLDNINLPVKLVKKYYLRKINNTYYLFGTIKTNLVFDKIKLTDIGVKTNSSVNNIYNISIPIPKMNLFFKLDGIEYFQIAETVQLNNH